MRGTDKLNPGLVLSTVMAHSLRNAPFLHGNYFRKSWSRQQYFPAVKISILLLERYCSLNDVGISFSHMLVFLNVVVLCFKTDLLIRQRSFGSGSTSWKKKNTISSKLFPVKSMK